MKILRQNIIKIYGSQGENWLSELPQTIEMFKEIWGLSQMKPFPNLSFSYVLEGWQGTTPVILKLSPDKDLIEKEAKALDAFCGFGAVRVLGREEGVLLLERAVPGDLLKKHWPKEGRIEIACGVMKRLHQAPLPEKGVFPNIEEWLDAIDREWALPKEHLERARRWKKELMNNRSEPRALLHGDLHQENILSQKNGWVVIDPKGVIGSPIHEVWACVEDPSQDLPFVSSFFSYPFHDVVGWYYIHLILAACWQAEDGLDAARFLHVAESVLPMIE